MRRQPLSQQHVGGGGTMADLRRMRRQVREFADRHHIVDVRVFGSVARGEARPNSDVDLLVTRASEASALDVAEFATDVEELLGCTVDIVDDAGGAELLSSIRATALPLLPTDSSTRARS